MGSMTSSPLACGILTGKYQRGQPWPEDSRYGRRVRMYGENDRTKALFSDRAFTVVETLSALAEQKGCTPSQLALAWNMRQPGITSPIIGPRTPQQLQDNLGAVDVTVTEEDRAKLDQVAPPGQMIAPYYQIDSSPHQFRW